MICPICHRDHSGVPSLEQISKRESDRKLAATTINCGGLGCLIDDCEYWNKGSSLKDYTPWLIGRALPHISQPAAAEQSAVSKEPSAPVCAICCGKLPCAECNQMLPVTDPTAPEKPSDAEQPRLYVASKTKHAEMWRQLRGNGAPIISSWIDEARRGQTADHAELSERCISEISRASSLLLYCEPEDILRGALIEAGAALTLGKRVFCVGHCESLSVVFQKHRLWNSCESVRDAIRAAMIGEQLNA